MASLTVLSWNIESLGTTKLQNQRFVQTFVDTVFNSAAQLALVMEVAPNAAGQVAMALSQALTAREGNSGYAWWPMVSDETGKTFDLPATIDPTADFAAGIDANTYFQTDFRRCYLNINGMWHLNGPNTISDITFCVQAGIRSGLLRNDREAYCAFFRYNNAGQYNQLNYYLNTAIDLCIMQGQWGLSWLDINRNLLGYQIATSNFNGRSPFLLGFRQATLQQNVLVPGATAPVLLFHAPFGNNKQMRVDAGQTLGSVGFNDAAAGAWTNMLTSAGSVICGDFNLDCKANDNVALQLYNYYDNNNFSVTFQDDNTTLRSAASANRLAATTNECLANAYDNIFVKAGLGVGGATVIDVINLMTQQGPVGGLRYVDTPVMGPTTQSAIYNAFVAYRTTISDHLPVVATVQF